MGAKVEIKSVRTNSEERSLRILSHDKYIPKPLSCYGKLSTVLVRILPKITFLLGGGRAVAAHIWGKAWLSPAGLELGCA